MTCAFCARPFEPADAEPVAVAGEYYHADCLPIRPRTTWRREHVEPHVHEEKLTAARAGLALMFPDEPMVIVPKAEHERVYRLACSALRTQLKEKYSMRTRGLWWRLKRAFARWLDCRLKRCSYYEHYLAYGPAELTHEGFHSAERHCEAAQQRVNVWYNEHPTGTDTPRALEAIANAWEKRVRA